MYTKRHYILTSGWSEKANGTGELNRDLTDIQFPGALFYTIVPWSSRQAPPIKGETPGGSRFQFAY